MRTLYRKRADGRISVYAFEIEGASSRIHQGVLGGKLRPSAWKTFKASCVGSAREISGEAVCRRRCNNLIKLMVKDRGWSESLEEVGVEKPFKPMTPLPWSVQKMRKYHQPCHVQPRLRGHRVFVSAAGIRDDRGRTVVHGFHITQALSRTFKQAPGLVLDAFLTGGPDEEEDLFDEALLADDKIAIESSLGLIVVDAVEGAGEVPFDLRYGFIRPMIEELSLLGYPVHMAMTEPVTSTKDIDCFAQEVLAAGYEGLIVRLSPPESVYCQGSSENLLERIAYYSHDYIVVKLIEGRGPRVGHTEEVLLKTSDLRNRFKAPMGGTLEDKREAWTKRKLLEGGSATVKFQKLHRDKRPFNPVVVELKPNEWTN